MKPRRKPGAGYLKMLEKDQEEKERKREIMGTAEERVSALTLSAWDDRVSRDLEIPYHKIELEHYEEWRRRGFEANGEDFEAKNMSEEDKIRLCNVSEGSAFRK